MRLCVFLLLHILGGGLTPALAQNYFEGELDYRNVFIDKQSFERLYEDISEMITIKGGKYKLNINRPQPGQLNWQIADFESGQSYEFKNYTISKDTSRNNTTPQNDSVFQIVSVSRNDSASKNDSVFTWDSPLIQKVNDTSNIFRIYEKQLCMDSSKVSPHPNKKTFSGLRILDTIMVIAGLNCNVMEDIKDGYRIAEYYYCDSIKLNPFQYSCVRMDGDDRLYKFINGSLITKRVLYDIDTYIYVLELQAIREKKIPDDVFELPGNLEVVRLNKQ